MNNVCVWSSLSFLAAGLLTGHAPLKILWVASSFNHAGHQWVYTFDKTLAHTTCLWSMLTIPRVHTLWVFLYWYGWAWTFCVYYLFGLSHIPPPVGDYWHASVHVMSSVGMVAHHKANPEPLNEPMFWALMIPVFVFLEYQQILFKNLMKVTRPRTIQAHT